MSHLEDGATSMYSMLLNTQGRVIFDTIVYKRNDNTFLLECESEKASQLVRHLKMYKVRRKLIIDMVDKAYSVWCVYDPELNMKEITHVDMESLYMNPKAESEVALPLTGAIDDVLVTRDPRMKYLGHRLIIPSSRSSLDDLVSGVQNSEGGFRNLRYRLGVGEGVLELPPTKCLPLEANLDYLHGVSFHKGCYIGQELTARTYHTGVIRKRYMPLVFSTNKQEPVTIDASVVNEKGKAVGKVRGIDGKFGIALLRVEECLKAESLMVNDIPVQTFRPAWWPIEASKKMK
ncbi:hypothetical protein Pcinc_017962 [Petrolisthes cinctipes]|uniref:CAF17 C-terminal domain-containing protein n=1 Tax=Petrolisthes cinctipes TaxID=88211 RepID=A0AAE1FT53_PETCI|nr:hypothetical protein Pcinc_017962 [Petrolisthes cinctipes]